MKKSKSKVSVFTYMLKLIEQLKIAEKYGTVETYIATMRSLKQFNRGDDLLFTELNNERLLMYEAYLLKRGLQKSTSSFYMRVLRAVYNRAVDDGIVEHKNIFKRIYVGIDKTIKRSVSQDYIKKIKSLDLKQDYMLIFSRDMFMFSFYTRGMSFVDIAYLKKSDLSNEMLTYRRRKTGQLLSIRVEACMKEIIDRYWNEDSSYLFPIIKEQNRARINYKSTLHTINLKLKIISDMVNSPIPLSMYVARHSWASIAKNKNIPISIISESMGHSSEYTTQIYLASLNSSVIDNANKIIISDI